MVQMKRCLELPFYLGPASSARSRTVKSEASDEEIDMSGVAITRTDSDAVVIYEVAVDAAQ